MKRALLLAWLAASAGCVYDTGVAQQSLVAGDVLLVQKDYAGAVRQYDQAIAQDPYLRDAFLHRGIAYRRLGQFERALANLDRAIELDKDFSPSYTERARAKVEMLIAGAEGDRRRLGEA